MDPIRIPSSSKMSKIVILNPFLVHFQKICDWVHADLSWLVVLKNGPQKMIDSITEDIWHLEDVFEFICKTSLIMFFACAC